MSGFKNRRYTYVRLRSQASTPIQSKKWYAADFGIQTSSIKILLIHGSTCVSFSNLPLVRLTQYAHYPLELLSWIFLLEGWKTKVSKPSFCSSLQRSGLFDLLFCASLSPKLWLIWRLSLRSRTDHARASLISPITTFRLFGIHGNDRKH